MYIRTTVQQIVLRTVYLCVLAGVIGGCSPNTLSSSEHLTSTKLSQVETDSNESKDFSHDKADALHYQKASAPLPKGLLVDPSSRVLFSPDDPTLSVELALINRVTNECLNDPERQSEYRIRYAVYNLTNDLITQELIKAAQAGVHVQVLIESEQLNQDRTWNLVNERFLSAGLSVEYDHRYLKDTERRDVHLIGIEARGLMHMKMRLYETPHWQRLMTGSLNPNTTSYLNDESLHLISDPQIINQYRIAYESLLYDWPFENEWHEDAGLNVLFTPVNHGERAIDRIFQWIAEEEEQILLMIFALRDLTAPSDSRSLVELLKEKAASGIPVYVITDRKQSDGVNNWGESVSDDDTTEDQLRQAGIPVYEVLNHATPYTAMHHKVAVLGLEEIKVISGAANWSNSGLGSRDRKARNVESVLFINSAKLDHNHTGHRFIAQWMRVLWRYASQSEELDQEQSALDLFSKLSSSHHWPNMQFSFEIETHSNLGGDKLAITGDLEQLGWWGLHGYHPLVQNEEDQIHWQSLDTITAPIGMPVNWKTIAINDQGEILRWENRNHHTEILSPSITQEDFVTFKGVWK